MSDTLIKAKPSLVINKTNYYDTDKISEIIQTSKMAIYRYFNNGTFPPVKFRNKFHISEENLYRYISEGKKAIYTFSDKLNYKEMKEVEHRVMEDTRLNLEIIKNYLEKAKMNRAPISKIKAMEERYTRAKQAYDDCKKEPISPDDM